MLNRALRTAAAWISAALLVIPLPAQNAAAPQQPAESTPTISVTTRLIQVNVVVHGKKADELESLTKDDFELFDNGQKQQIATFAMEKVGSVPKGADAPKPLPANTFTNRTEVRATVPKAITVILLDNLNTAFADQAYSRKQLIAFLHTLTADDRVALYTLGTNLKVLFDFTEDPEALIKAIEKHRGRAGFELSDSLPEASDTGNDDLDAFLDQANQRIADYQTINRVNTTLEALEGIANHVSRLPGRKNLIWISGGFPFSIGMEEMNIDSTNERRTFTDEMERAARAVTAASMAIYPVDARGLVPQLDFDAGVRGNVNPRRPPQTGPSKKMDNLQKTHDTMNIMAERTGGKAYYNTNDLKSAIRGAIDDAKVTYVLGFYPSHNSWDGKFHEIKVRARKGVNIRYRAGYFAFPDRKLTDQTRMAAIKDAIWSPLDDTNIGLTARLGPNLPKQGALRVLMGVDAKNIKLEPKADRWTGSIDVVFVQQAAPDKPGSIVNQQLALNLTKATYDNAMKHGFVFMKDLDYTQAAYKLKIVVRDALSGNVGTVNIRTDKLKPETPKPASAK